MPVDSSTACLRQGQPLACAALGRRRTADPYCWQDNRRGVENRGVVVAVAKEVWREDDADTDAARVLLLPLPYRAVNRRSHTRKSLEIVWALDVVVATVVLLMRLLSCASSLVQ